MKDRYKISVIGLGYVGLPVAVAFGKKRHVIGFDISEARIAELKTGRDSTREVKPGDLQSADIHFTSDPGDLCEATFHIIAVPTPIDEATQPDLRPLLKATEIVGRILKPGDFVVYESTVYPGVTEDVCGPSLARVSGLAQGVDFSLGYSPERINPGDSEHNFSTITKVISAQDEKTLKRLEGVYGPVVKAGLHRAPSIKTAEAAKVVENTQRDLNVALMNELALICDRLDIRTADVLEAARTKWNFIPFMPGLVGGHCIGVDPYYLTTRAEQVGYNPQVILAGRRINDSMGVHVANKMVDLLTSSGKTLENVRVGIMGLSFKENVPDLRNSRVPDIVRRLSECGIRAFVHDPIANAEDAMRQYGIELLGLEMMADLDGLVLAVPHEDYLKIRVARLCSFLKPDSILMDVKSALNPTEIPLGITYWSL